MMNYSNSLLCFSSIFNIFYRAKTDKKSSSWLQDLIQFTETMLINHIIKLEMTVVQFSKDYEFNFSTWISLLLNLLNNREDYIEISLILLRKFIKSGNHLFIYLKSFIINCPNLSEDILLDVKFNHFEFFLNKYLLALKEEEYSLKGLNLYLMEFFKIFFENDLKSNFTNLKIN